MDLLMNFLSSPLAFTTLVLVSLLSMLVGMVFGKKKGNTESKTWAFRETGAEILFVFFPFVLYSIANLLNGTFLKFLNSPELPMASMIVLGMSIFSLIKGAYAASGKIRLEPFIILIVISLLLFMSFAGFIFWLTLHSTVSDWFSFFNALSCLVAVGFSYAIQAAMNHIIKNPDEISIQS
jgi:hypothetical protein